MSLVLFLGSSCSKAFNKIVSWFYNPPPTPQPLACSWSTDFHGILLSQAPSPGSLTIPETSETSGMGTMADVSSHSLLRSPSQHPSFKLSCCDWRLKGQHPLWRWTISKSSLLTVAFIVLCQRLHLCVSCIGWYCQKSSGLGTSLVRALPWLYR